MNVRFFLSDKIINGKYIAENLLEKIKKRSLEFKKETNRSPTLVVIIVGENPASKIYVNNKIKISQSVNFQSINIQFPVNINETDILKKIEELNSDDNIDGILVQLPLPKHISTENVINKISIRKDVDGFHPVNFGNLCLGNDTIVPCTPLGCLHLIKKEIQSLDGLNVTILGRSNIVGKPIQALLLNESCTTTITHSKSKNLQDFTKQADILVVAIGKPEFITEEYVKKDAFVIDVGINRIVSSQKIVGDVKFDNVIRKVKKITPVPGGVGPMTIAMLMYNTIKLSFTRNKIYFKEIL